MTVWTVILVLGVTAIWAALGAAMAYLVARAPRTGR
jgi:ABC-type Fe3+ transport system permease subunit